MSLVNDVLRQIDNKSDIKSDGLSVAAVSRNEKSGTNIKTNILLLVTAFLLSMTVALIVDAIRHKNEIANVRAKQLTQKPLEKTQDDLLLKSEVEKDYLDEYEYSLRDIIDDAEPVANIKKLGASDQKEPARQDDIIAETHISKQPIAAYKTKSSVKSEEKTPNKRQAKDTTFVKTVAAQKKETSHPRVNDFVITRDASALYNKSLSYFKNKQYAQSIDSIRKAIKFQGREKYYLLLLRNYLKTQDKQRFLSEISIQKFSSLAWLSSVASGLYMFSEYSSAEIYFSKVVSLSSKNMRWKIAQAINYESGKKLLEAKKIYQLILVDNTISLQQRRQIETKYQQIEEQLINKGANDGS